MSDPYEHNQLATLDSMNINYDSDGETFSLERTFDFAQSPELDAESVAGTWQEMFDETDMGGEVSVADSTLRLSFEYEGVKTRHDLKPLVSMIVSEMVSMLATHNSSHAVAVAESVVDSAEEMDDMLD